MKAIILAGGEGTRLRPLCSNTPKPMTSLFDRPVMEYIVDLLKRQGIREIGVTLGYMPEVIREHFGSGTDFDVSMSYFTEETPLGTAGGILGCSEFLCGSDEPFVVISGDCVCDFSFAAALKRHIENDADVTIMLYRHENPLEYGLVLASDKGKVERFIEKPVWGQVFTDTINTGIYIISPRILSEIPSDTKYDFARDLFPKLLAKGTIYACPMNGYWCDVGDPDAFLQCAWDIMDGKVDVLLPAREENGIWCNTQLPDGVKITPPVYIGDNAKIGSGSDIGPYAIVGAGSIIGKNTFIEKSMITGGRIGDRVSAIGSAICKNAVIGAFCGLGEGCVIGEGAIIGANSVIFDAVRIWPHKNVSDGQRVRFNLSANMTPCPAIDENGEIRGEINVDITPEFCTSLGSAVTSCCAQMSAYIGLSSNCFDTPQMLTSACEAGIRASGAVAVLLDSPNEIISGHTALSNGLSAVIHIKTVGANVTICVLDEIGLPFGACMSKKLQGLLRRGDYLRTVGQDVGKCCEITGNCRSYSVFCAYSIGKVKNFAYNVSDSNSSCTILNDILTLMSARREKIDVPVFEPSSDGRSLCCIDELHRPCDDAHTRCMAAYCAMSGGKTVYTLENDTGVLEPMSMAMGSRVLRIGAGSDYKSRIAYAKCRYMYDGVYRAAFIISYLSSHNMRLCELYDRIPVFKRVSREFSVVSDRGQIMRALTLERFGDLKECGEGMRIEVNGGWVYLTPCTVNQAVRVTVDAFSSETAAELCDTFERMTKKLDAKNPPVKNI